jgi:hypothetical protein
MRSCRFCFFSVLPPLMHLALLMRLKVAVALKKLCAFLAVPPPQSGQVFYRLRILELCEMLLVAQVGVDLVEVARMAARLLLGVLSSYGWHDGRWAVSVPRPSVIRVRSRMVGYRKFKWSSWTVHRAPCLQVERPDALFLLGTG